MGQYWKAVNLDKHEFIHPHTLGAGAKIGEQLGTHVGSALIILCASMPERNGPKRTTEMPRQAAVDPDYNAVAHRTIGRWAGDRIALVGDYAEDSDLAPEHQASTIYRRCSHGEWLDVTEDVCTVIEHECTGKFTGDGWRTFVPLAAV